MGQVVGALGCVLGVHKSVALEPRRWSGHMGFLVAKCTGNHVQGCSSARCIEAKSGHFVKEKR